jgi:hypothetical protein
MPSTGPFSLIPPINTTSHLVSDNNLLLDYFPPEMYESNKLFGNIVMAASILSLAMFLLGLYKGKLIGL